jgi:putative transcriptional regulator
MDVTEEPRFLTGRLLIAMPSITEGQLSHSVIFMCAHTPDGAMGIQLNRPIEQPSFDDLLRQLNIEPAPPARRIQLMSGGPVDNARGFVLHTSDWTVDSSLQVDDDHALTASLDVLKAIAEGGGPTLGFLALGYVGWGAGQLDDEMRRGAWLEAPADELLLFGGEYDQKWRRALAKLRIDPIMLSASVGHA